MTHPSRIDGILSTGAIKAVPPLPKRVMRPTLMPNPAYVRSLGGVSVFDFDNPMAQRLPYSTQIEPTVPFPGQWGGAVWMKIDPDQVEVIPAIDLVDRYRRDHGDANPFLSQQAPIIDPYIEGAVIGDIPWSAVCDVHLVTFLGPGHRQYSPDDIELRPKLAREIAEWRRQYMAMLEENTDHADWRQCFLEFGLWW